MSDWWAACQNWRHHSLTAHLSLCFCYAKVVTNPARHLTIVSAWDGEVSGWVGYDLKVTLLPLQEFEVQAWVANSESAPWPMDRGPVVPQLATELLIQHYPQGVNWVWWTNPYRGVRSEHLVMLVRIVVNHVTHLLTWALAKQAPLRLTPCGLIFSTIYRQSLSLWCTWLLKR